uniref:Uncharacterized protein n=1 Tax=viral metagenome TaxID=1070528 RepID=A0A6H1ZC64_9ZZZZ
MREYELIIDEALKNGLTPFRTTPFNSQLLHEFLGFRCGKGGVEKYETKDNPLPPITDILYDWPFPQFITGERYNFLIVRDSITNLEDIVYLVSDDMNTVTHIFSIDQLTFGQGTLMEVADFGEYAFMTNGVIMIYWDIGLADWHEIVASPTIPMMRTICNFKGQAVGGNVVSDWPSAANPQCDDKYYIWSRIGELDFTISGRNEEGYRRDPFGGTIYHTRRLGDNVIGYSSKGITMLSPVSSPAATFGFTELDDVGLINQGAMNGNLDRHVYVGEDYILREVTRQGVKELGYESYMSELDSNDVIVSYDRKLKDFYISDGVRTFLLSSNGLSEIPQHPSAIWRRNSETYMLPDAVDDYKASITTEPFDMGYSGQKTIFSMETDLLLADSPEVAVDYYTNPTLYGTTPYIPLNNQNVASIIASGNAFAFHLRFDPTYDNSRISYIKARYKMTDLRGIRGVYAPPLRGQS